MSVRASISNLTRRGAIAAAALSLLACVGACDRHCGDHKEHTGPARVVPFSPGLAVLMRDMGLSDRIVGRHAYDITTATSVPEVGDEGGVDEEAMLRIKPDVVLVQRSAHEPPGFLTRSHEKGSLSLFVVPLLSLDDIPQAVKTIDRALAQTESRPCAIDDPASPAAVLLAQMERAFTPHPGRHSGAGRVLLLGAANPPAAFGPGSWHHDLLVRVGATPAITEGGPYITLDTEDVLRLRPDVIILVEAQPPDDTPVRDRLGPIAELDVPACVHGHWAAIDDPLVLTPSSAMIDLAHRLEEILSKFPVAKGEADQASK